MSSEMENNSGTINLFTIFYVSGFATIIGIDSLIALVFYATLSFILAAITVATLLSYTEKEKQENRKYVETSKKKKKKSKSNNIERIYIDDPKHKIEIDEDGRTYIIKENNNENF